MWEHFGVDPRFHRLILSRCPTLAIALLHPLQMANGQSFCPYLTNLDPFSRA